MSSEKSTRSPGRPGLTYETVAAAADAMVAAGEKITNAAVIARVGGSSTTISKFVSRWDSQRPKMQVANIEIAPSVQREIAREIERHVTETSAVLREQLAECVSTRDAITVESEERGALLEDIEQQLAEALATVTEQTAAVGELRVAEERERVSAGQLRIELAQAKMKLDDLPSLQLELAQLRKDVSSAETKSAGLVATLDATRDRLTATEQRASAAVIAEHDALTKAAALDAAIATAVARTEAAIQRADDAVARATAADARAEAAQTRLLDLLKPPAPIRKKSSKLEQAQEPQSDAEAS
jgi:colicin import membrane protein